MKKFFFLMALCTMVLSLQAEAYIGYVMTMADIADFPAEEFEGTAQQPEKNAAQWFKENYVDKGIGRFVTVPEVAMGGVEALSDLKAIWVNLDRMGTPNLAAYQIDADFVKGLGDYVKAGGNLFMTKKANQIIYEMGRMGYAPGWNDTGYHMGGDDWAINPYLALWEGLGGVIDKSKHPLYEGLETVVNPDHGKDVFPMVGANPRTDNNDFWVDYFRKDPVTGGKMEAQEGYTHYDNGNPLRLSEYEADWNLEVLGVWGQVQDHCSGGLVIFKPEGDFKGTIVSCGFAAYQWGSGNLWLDNVKKLSANALEYVAPAGTAVENVTTTQVVKGVYNLLGQKVERENMVRGSIYIVDGKKVIF